MQLRQRIKKLEKQSGTGSAFCECGELPRYEIFRADLSIDSESSKPLPMGETVPDICPDCRKPTEKTRIIVQFCDQSTKDRFPDEWKGNAP